MNRKELSEVVAECAARTEQAAARTETARASIEVSAARTEAARTGIEEARAGIEEARKRQEAAIAKNEEDREELKAMRKRTEQMFEDFIRRADENNQFAARVFAELDDQRDERRALIEALLQAIDRLPPPPPHLRSA